MNVLTQVCLNHNQCSVHSAMLGLYLCGQKERRIEGLYLLELQETLVRLVVSFHQTVHENILVKPDLSLGPSIPLSSCMTTAKLPDFSETQFCFLHNEDEDSHQEAVMRMKVCSAGKSQGKCPIDKGHYIVK